MDIDVTVQVIPEDPERLVAAMTAGGFDLRVQDPGFVAATRVLPLVHRPSGWLVDVVLAGPGLEERFLDRAVDVSLGDDLDIKVISPEDLIVTKILAGRPKDLDDARGVMLERLPQLDLGAIRETLRLLEQALAVGDLAPTFETELARAERDRGGRPIRRPRG
jgi:hypothetical protein